MHKLVAFGIGNSDGGFAIVAYDQVSLDCPFQVQLPGRYTKDVTAIESCTFKVCFDQVGLCQVGLAQIGQT